MISNRGNYEKRHTGRGCGTESYGGRLLVLQHVVWVLWVEKGRVNRPAPGRWTTDNQGCRREGARCSNHLSHPAMGESMIVMGEGFLHSPRHAPNSTERCPIHSLACTYHTRSCTQSLSSLGYFQTSLGKLSFPKIYTPR